jgi:Leu/Phe-tRNA-protein transferase
MIKIDKDIPPPITKLIGVTIEKLQVGESFFIEKVDEATRTALYRKCRELKSIGKLFTSMLEDGGVRTWRLE